MFENIDIKNLTLRVDNSVKSDPNSMSKVVKNQEDQEKQMVLKFDF